MATIRNFLLGGVASLFLAGAAQSAAPLTSANSEAIAPIALNSLSSPPDKIATAKVVDDQGMIVGAVQKVDLDQSGKPTRVEIALLGGDKTIALEASRLSYDQSNNILTAALDKAQIGQLPNAG